MTTYIIRRLLWLPVLLVAVSLVTFALGLYGPGDPVQVMVGLHTNPTIVEQVRRELGLDRPFLFDLPAAQQALQEGQGPGAALSALFDGQYFRYMWNALHLNFGYSLVKYQGQTVSQLIGQRLPVTLQLNLVSLLWSVPAGLVLGVMAGVRRNSLFDLIARGAVLFGVSLPIILLLPLLTFIVSRGHEIGLGSVQFTVGPFLPVGGWEGIFSTKIILPAFIEGLGVLAVFTRQTRAGIIEVLGQDYIRTARAKGLREQMVLFRHALRNALLPLVTITGFLLGSLVSGSFLVENWYGIPGIGALSFDSLLSRDYYIIMALVLIVAVGYTLANLFIDLAYALVDPRIRYTGS